jgi:hypothetical protein
MVAFLQFTITLVVVLAVGGWLLGTESGKALVESFSSARSKREKARHGQTLSARGVHGEGGAGLACPKCGGSQFKVARKNSTKIAFGAASMLGQAHWVRCVTCGTRYRRG